MISVVNWLRSLFPKILYSKSFIRNVMLLAGGTALGQGIVILTSPILTRLYTPADFGVLAVYTSIFSILSVVVSLRYELAIPLPKDSEAAANLLVLSLLIVPGMSLLVGFSLFLLGDRIVDWVNTPALRPYLWFLPISLLGMGTYQALNYWAVRKKAFNRIAQTKLGRSFGQVLTHISLGLLKLGPLGLLLGSIVGQVSGSRILAKVAWRQDRRVLQRVTMAGLGQVARRYRRFPLISSWSALLNRTGLDMPSLLLAAFYGPQVVGWFGLGKRVIKMPMTLVGRSVSQVYIGEASQLVQENPRMLQKLFLKTALRLLLVGGIPIALLGFVSPWLFALVFGQLWREAGVYAQLLAPMFATEFVAVPISSTLNILERQDIQLAWDIGRFVLVVATLWSANALEWSPVQAVGAYSGCMLMAYLVLFGLTYYVLAKIACR